MEELVVPVAADEADRTGVPAGSEIPQAISQVVEQALLAPIAELIERGVVGSAEVLAELVPQLVASTTALAYPDEAARTLMAATYQAFRRRRSLLLLNLEHQVRSEELPWVAAMARHRRTGPDTRSDAREALVRLGELALQGFPATILPNPLIRELDALARAADVDVPLVEELAADIFMGEFSTKFLRAAKVAAEVLAGTLYERYYGVDYAAVDRITVARKRRGRFAAVTADGFADLCRRRANVMPGVYEVVANGMVIEQAQILTTHNLAALAGPIGVRPGPGWPDLAHRAFTRVCRLAGRLRNNRRPLPTIKDAAYGWRQMVFYLAMSDHNAVEEFLDRAAVEVPVRLEPALAGLRHVADGGTFEDAPRDARRFHGWTTGDHWLHPS